MAEKPTTVAKIRAKKEHRLAVTVAESPTEAREVSHLLPDEPMRTENAKAWGYQA